MNDVIGFARVNGTTFSIKNIRYVVEKDSTDGKWYKIVYEDGSTLSISGIEADKFFFWFVYHLNCKTFA